MIHRAWRFLVAFVLSSALHITLSFAQDPDPACYFYNQGWSECSTTCGPDGVRSKRVNATLCADLFASNPEFIPDADDMYTITEDCYMGPCQEPCVLSAWTCWCPCSAPCGGGDRMRDKTVIQPALFGADDCNTDDMLSNETCNTHDCPTDCEIGQWGVWSDCSEECSQNGRSNGFQKRTREIKKVLSSREGASQICPSDEEERLCNVQPCPKNCTLTDWTNWSTCARECSEETHERWRQVVQYPQNCGDDCGPLYESEPCNTCPCDLEPLRWECEKRKDPDWLAYQPCSPCYVRCDGWYKVGHVIPCPPNTVFVRSLRRCLVPAPGLCGPSPVPPPTPPPYRPLPPYRPAPPAPPPYRPAPAPTAPPPGKYYPPYVPRPPVDVPIPGKFCVGKSDGFYVGPANKRCYGRFVVCRKQRTIEKWCDIQKGLLFDVTNRKCLHYTQLRCPKP